MSDGEERPRSGRRRSRSGASRGPGARGRPPSRPRPGVDLEEASSRSARRPETRPSCGEAVAGRRRSSAEEPRRGAASPSAEPPVPPVAPPAPPGPTRRDPSSTLARTKPPQSLGAARGAAALVRGLRLEARGRRRTRCRRAALARACAAVRGRAAARRASRAGCARPPEPPLELDLDRRPPAIARGELPSRPLSARRLAIAGRRCCPAGSLRTLRARRACRSPEHPPPSRPTRASVYKKPEPLAQAGRRADEGAEAEKATTAEGARG